MYSLGATLYHALTGHVPFDAPTVRGSCHRAGADAADAAEPGACRKLPQTTSDALVKTMAKNPSDRFLSYDEFIMSLEAARSLLLRERSNAPQSPGPSKSKGLTSWWRPLVK